MEVRSRLESNLVAEAEAYGYTLSVWGAGALLIHAYGVPDFTEAMAYVLGGIVGFGALALGASSGVRLEADGAETPSSRVASTMHLIATGGSLAAVHLVVLSGTGVRIAVVFFAAGVVVTVSYNLLLLLEELIATVVG